MLFRGLWLHLNYTMFRGGFQAIHVLKAEYHKGHLHEIETMLLIIQEE